LLEYVIKRPAARMKQGTFSLTVLRILTYAAGVYS